ncbi:hypothetical protein EMCRGX_G031763 [Ephydatia muelleri]
MEAPVMMDMVTYTNCTCAPGFNGPTCSNDINYCTPTTCLNGGTCVEGLGPLTSCSCAVGFAGSNCNTDLPFCTSTTCLNGGTCVEGLGPLTSCSCAVGFAGSNCNTDVPICTSTTCLNGGTCVEGLGPLTSCSCAVGFAGSNCTTDLPFCTSTTCLNGGTCYDGYGTYTNCTCAPGFNGPTCSNDHQLLCTCAVGFSGADCSTTSQSCSSNPCQHGGSCRIVSGREVCTCSFPYTGTYCDILMDYCTEDVDCLNDTYCNVQCPADSYPAHTTLLEDAVVLKGNSFVRVDSNRYPDFSGSVSMFALFRQTWNTSGYLVFFGTSGDQRNWGVFIECEPLRVHLYYTNATLAPKGAVFNLAVNICDSQLHYLALIYDKLTSQLSLILDGDGSSYLPRKLRNPLLLARISPSKPGTLIVGARLPRAFRIRRRDCPDYILQLTAPSLLCQSSKDRCDLALRCLESYDGSYTCQKQPISCLADQDCDAGYFCGSQLPVYPKSYYESVSSAINGQVIFLQKSSMSFDGISFVSLPSTSHPPSVTDLTIFSTVCQTPGNDGYLLGKGVNDRMRDFGLYLRSTKKTIWLAYGVDGNNPGFRDIIFFYNVSVADGNCHSVAAVIDSGANSAFLYIDGQVVGHNKPLNSTVNLRPGYNMLYVGGRPGTSLFRFKGAISNLLVASAPLKADKIATLDKMSRKGGAISTLDLQTSTGYCYKYTSPGGRCYVNQPTNFRCQSPAVCLPSYNSTSPVGLPIVGTLTSFNIPGVCVSPCNCPATPTLTCGADGRTYLNTCIRDCYHVPASLTTPSGACPSFT